MFLMLSIAFAMAAFSIYILRPMAIKLSFVDRPNERKLHQGNVPLIGGLSIFFPITFVLLLFPELINNSEIYILSSSLLLLIGFIDDKVDLSVTIRIFLIGVISSWLVLYADFRISYLGDLFGFGKVVLTSTDLLLTVAAIIGSITAFNMVDGLDGLLGGLASVTLGAMAILFGVNEQYDLLLFCCIVIASLTPYIICNLELLPNKKMKVFMGDSGSLFIGFTVVWLLIESSQGYDGAKMIHKMNPVTSLWIIAIPLMDMVYTMLRRIRKKQSPFKADREHIHHVFARLGFSPLQTLLTICSIATFFALIGIAGELLHIPEALMFFAFISAFIAYYFCFTHIWKVTVFLRRSFSSFK